MNKTYIKPLNYYTAAECQTILDFTAARGRGGALPTGSLKTRSHQSLGSVELELETINVLLMKINV